MPPQWLRSPGLARQVVQDGGPRAGILGKSAIIFQNILWRTALKNEILNSAAADPHAMYDRLRANEPVAWIEAFQGWLVTRYEDCVAVLKDEKNFTADRMHDLIRVQFPFASEENAPLLFEQYSTSMMVRDLPEHTRIRSYTNRGFTPRALKTYHNCIERVVEDLLTGFECAPGASIDLQTEFATVVPSIVIAEIIGVPVADRERFLEWGAAIGLNGSAGRSPAMIEKCEAGMRDFVDYMEKPIAERRITPGNDMLTYLIAGESEGRINSRELCHQIIQFVSAGQITTLDMLGVGILAFLENPREIRRLLDDPELIDNAVQEVLRYTSPSQLVHRKVKQEVTIGGQRLLPGQLVFPVLAAANRDPEIFENPHDFDITRANAKKNVAFGAGAHFCIGGNLAQLEGRLVFSELFSRLPGLRLRAKPVWRKDGLYFRGLQHLPAAWDKPAEVRPPPKKIETTPAPNADQAALAAVNQRLSRYINPELKPWLVEIEKVTQLGAFRHPWETSARSQDEIETARASLARFFRGTAPPDAVMKSVRDILVEHDGRSVPCRLLIPPGAPADAPIILFIHGGGMVLGSPDMYEAALKCLARSSNAMILCPQYRLAPEYPYPASFEDCRLVYDWLFANARDLGADPAKIVVAGDSAGGGMAALLAQQALANQKKRGPGLSGVCESADRLGRAAQSCALSEFPFFAAVRRTELADRSYWRRRAIARYAGINIASTRRPRGTFGLTARSDHYQRP